MTRTFLILALTVFGIPVLLYLFWVVHCTLTRICLTHARRFCQRNALEIRRVRWQPAFEPSGGKRVKTESTLVELDCLDARQQRRLVKLVVWPFGIRRLISDEIYPESHDNHWPPTSA
jgi:hypothetical protein